jgi:hypothetical protein
MCYVEVVLGGEKTGVLLAESKPRADVMLDISSALRGITL